MTTSKSKIIRVQIDGTTGRVDCVKCGESNTVTKASNGSDYIMNCRCGYVMQLRGRTYRGIVRRARVTV